MKDAAIGRAGAPAARSRWIAALSLASILGPMLAVALATQVLGVHPARVLRDPNAYFGHPFYIGFFSNLGILGWWTATVACLLAALVPGGDPPERQALFWGGLLSAMLGVDDLFLLHEQALPDYLGMPEQAVLALHLLATLAYLWCFRNFHAALAPGLLAAALALFGLSLAVDLILVEDGPDGLNLLLEDGVKFAGICAWAAYHGLAAYLVLDGRGA